MFEFKYDRFKVVQWSNGKVLRTVKVDEQWFPEGKEPEVHVLDQDDCFWVNTTDWRYV